MDKKSPRVGNQTGQLREYGIQRVKILTFRFSYEGPRAIYVLRTTPYPSIGTEVLHRYMKPGKEYAGDPTSRLIVEIKGKTVHKTHGHLVVHKRRHSRK